MEPVPECQSPLFLHVDAADRETVRLYFSAPAEAPTTRGFAAILAAGLDKQPAEDILAVPDDFYSDLGLAALISPLRLRGMSAMLARIKSGDCGASSQAAHSASTLKLPRGYILKDVLRRCHQEAKCLVTPARRSPRCSSPIVGRSRSG